MNYSEISFDGLTKSDSNFPHPEDNKILVEDGMGFKYKHAKKLFPAGLLCPVFSLSGAVEFAPLFRSSKKTRAFLFDLPQEFSIQFNISNRRYQEVLRQGQKLFYVFYDRDYDSIRIEADDLVTKLKEAGLKVPKPEINSVDRSLWRYTERQDWVPYEQLELPVELKNEFHRS